MVWFKALKLGRRSLVTLVFAPFAALAALLALIIISISFLMMAVETIIGVSIGSGAVYNFGVGQLPSFWF